MFCNSIQIRSRYVLSMLFYRVLVVERDFERSHILTHINHFWVWSLGFCHLHLLVRDI